MTTEPSFIAQMAEPAPPDERMVWIQCQVEAGKAAGATFFRASVHPDIPDLTLVEGWIEQPEDQGEPRFQMVSQP